MKKIDYVFYDIDRVGMFFVVKLNLGINVK